MKQKTAYTMLMASLPPHPMSLWDFKRKPVTRLRLERQLKLLTEQDSQQLAAIESILHWAKIQQANSDAEIAIEADRVIQSIHNPLLHEAIIWRLELRIIVTAIRRRKLNHPPPEKHEPWGYGQVLPLIRNNWQLDDFGLSHRFPWVAKAQTLFAADQSVELEKLLLNLSWQHYARIGQAHYFDFEAVVLYVLRWDIVNRWTQCNEQAAMLEFEALVNRGLGDFLQTA
ncbi:hypothetical protein AU255_08305 [Methyloprofundus sedimenti]|uniref:Uncharacterized protein n=1 Tax=Methyloprofundus sedimenti TaxID=1420851 RepID=A0A1V8M8D8_9GAMM|nr:DUF2764 family protein [Methyloprofundus sedimenti]OQK17850.1 hypothetical protein AU255_08305 [Methyloprofundus sedimenti]